jgi:hypothetical protein
MKNTCPLCKKINPPKKYEKTDFGFLTPRLLLVRLHRITIGEFLSVYPIFNSDWLELTNFITFQPPDLNGL